MRVFRQLGSETAAPCGADKVACMSKKLTTFPDVCAFVRAELACSLFAVSGRNR